MSMEMVAQVRDFSKSRGNAKFLLFVIASHINPQLGWAWPSLETLAHETTLSKPTVLKLIDALIALGELEVVRGRGRGHSNRYRITIAHEAPEDRPDEDDMDHVKGKESGNCRAPEDPAEGSEEDEDDHPKGKPRLYLLPPLPEMEKVNTTPEKVKLDPGKGKPSVTSKEVLRTSKETTERVALDLEKVKGQELDEWIRRSAPPACVGFPRRWEPHRWCDRCRATHFPAG
jgi:Helix-turn-helix domain